MKAYLPCLPKDAGGVTIVPSYRMKVLSYEGSGTYLTSSAVALR